MSKITVQILGWNNAQDLPACLAPLAAIPAEEADIVYIDNHSSDGSIETVRGILPRATVISLPENMGYGRAHNIGFSRCRTPYVLTLNPDTRVRWEGIRKLLALMEKDPRAAACQGMLLRDATSNIIDSAGVALSLSLNGIERGAGDRDEGQYDSQAALIAVTGACALYRIKALREVAYGQTGGAYEIFDRFFFAYKEDVDLGWRLNRALWRVLYEPVFTGTHSRSLAKRNPFFWGGRLGGIHARLRDVRTAYSFKNYVWMVAKNASLGQLVFHSPFIALRLFTFFGLACAYPPLFLAWLQALQRLPSMIRRRAI